MATDAELSEWIAENRGLLCWHALQRLHRHHRDDVEDVVSVVVLDCWRNRANIRDVGAYLVSAVCILAGGWHKRNHRDTTLSGREWTRENNYPSPERQLIAEEAERERENRRTAILGKLAPNWRAHYREWENRNFRCSTHAEQITASRVRRMIAERAGVRLEPRRHVPGQSHIPKSAVCVHTATSRPSV